MKKLRIACFMLLTMFLSLGFTSCNDDIKDWAPDEATLDVNHANMVGTWRYTYYNYTTVADDYVEMQLDDNGSMTTTYYDVDGKVKTVTSTGKDAIYTGKWSLNGNTFTTTDSEGKAATATVKWITNTTLYLVLPTDSTTKLNDQMMAYTRVK